MGGTLGAEGRKTKLCKGRGFIKKQIWAKFEVSNFNGF